MPGQSMRRLYSQEEACEAGHDHGQHADHLAIVKAEATSDSTDTTLLTAMTHMPLQLWLCPAMPSRSCCHTSPTDADEKYNKQHDQWTLGSTRVAGCDINKQVVRIFVHLNAIVPATGTA